MSLNPQLFEVVSVKQSTEGDLFVLHLCALFIYLFVPLLRHLLCHIQTRLTACIYQTQPALDNPGRCALILLANQEVITVFALSTD